MHEEVQQVRIQWGSGLVRMELEMRDHSRFKENALAGGSAEILDGCEVITQSGESHESGSCVGSRKCWKESNEKLLSLGTVGLTIGDCRSIGSVDGRRCKANRCMCKRQVSLIFLDMLGSESLDVGCKDVERVLVVFPKNSSGFFWHRREINDGGRAVNLLSLLRIIDLTRHKTTEQVTQYKHHLLQNHVRLGVDVGTQHMEVPAFK